MELLKKIAALDANMQRIDETAADESLREAICNALILVEDFFRGGNGICCSTNRMQNESCNSRKSLQCYK